ncbi:amino acid transporter [Corynebacterium ulcerans]|uniref:amino acid transporter n=1 Tax=Corynebacterium ulcerans TaxID=65058 RepID=UPI00148F2395|nr:amino acid transporter [Corynebacterium ulcerans]NOL57741.1 amino acid transporter [Corynebacterium ulcerans]NOM02011.1 amino acid transporter [Corynebacterium ulcerans]
MTHLVKRDRRLQESPATKHPWWKVMCLTGVDYYSTLGYQPGIAVVAAGALAPIATLVLVAVTMLGAVPVYRRIARESPDGQGSIAVLSHFVHGWKGKFLILVLLGFAATDFTITMTLSASDATAHLLHTTSSPWTIPLTIAMLASLALVFYRGFTEAIRVSVVLVSVYLVLTAIIVTTGLIRIGLHLSMVGDWWHSVIVAHPHPLGIILVALLVFPKLALGLSGFETGVAVIPQIDGGTEGRTGKVRAGRKLLLVAASIMSVFLIASSIVVTLLVPADSLIDGGPANGRALAYLAHEQFGPFFGGAYDLVTVVILWFAGASAMAGMINLIPRYLPRYGMAPAWVAKTRPMVKVVAVITFVVAIIFRANVDKQSGAYATGVLVLLLSGALAVTLSAAVDVRRKHGRYWKPLAYGLVTLVLGYTAITNMVERPEGLKVAFWFIVAIIVVSMVSRVGRAFELRSPIISYDEKALRIIGSTCGPFAIIAHSIGSEDPAEYERKEHEVRARNHIPDSQPVIFLEVGIRDASEFSSALVVTGHVCGDHTILRTESAAIPNAIAALAVDMHHRGNVDVYFSWSPGSPVRDMLRYLAIGKGQNAVVVHEIIRRANKDGKPHPHVHLG